MIHTSYKPAHEQQGIILFVVIVFLLIIALGSIAASQSAQLAEKIAGNHWEQERALQSSEAGLQDGSNWMFSQIDTTTREGSSTGSDKIWTADSMIANILDPTYDWSDAIGFGADTSASTAPFSANNSAPKYLITYVGFARDNMSGDDAAAGAGTYYYSVSAVGYGIGDSARAVTQSVVAKRYQ